MIIKSTNYSDLLCYYYNETDLLDSDRIQRAIDGDPILQNEYNELNEMMELIAIPTLEPSAKSIERILALA